MYVHAYMILGYQQVNQEQTCDNVKLRIYFILLYFHRHYHSKLSRYYTRVILSLLLS